MPKLIDLTHIIEDGTPAYPGDERCRLVQTRTVARDGYSSFLFNTGLHAGTHLDAPLHFLAEGKMVKDIPLETFMGRGRLLDVRGEDPIVFKDEYKELVEPGDIVLLWTDCSRKFGRDEYYTAHPVVDQRLAEFLIERGIKMLGMDMPSPDRMPFALHKSLLMAGIPLLENLTALDALQDAEEFEITAFPLRISAEGSPVRVVAKVG
ncbi:MAG: cyclase family protein [Bacillota bacterium]|jgi:kynurenine formamidase|nr:cyclase family protein [Bacillota bacterium]NLJ04015.1 cyclase family protein [Bacillota bacterium]